jgi:hypothetical protein
MLLVLSPKNRHIDNLLGLGPANLVPELDGFCRDADQNSSSDNAKLRSYMRCYLDSRTNPVDWVPHLLSLAVKWRDARILDEVIDVKRSPQILQAISGKQFCAIVQQFGSAIIRSR